MKKFFDELYKLKVELINIFHYPSIKFNQANKFNYDIYWQIRNKSEIKKPNNFHEKRARLLFKYIEENNIPLNTDLLDIGSGDGRQLEAIQKRIKNLSITSSDISKKSLDQLSKKYKTIAIKSGLDFIEENYNLITAFEVLEHLEKPEESLYYFLSKADSAFIFSVPNTGFIFHRLRLLFGNFPLQWKTFPGEHLRFWTYKDMQWWLSSYLGIDKNDYKIICYAHLFPFLVKIFPFLSPIFSKGMFIHISKKRNID